MDIIKNIALVLTIVGALNWGLIGIFNINLVTMFVKSSMIYNLIYILIGVSSLISISYLFNEKMTNDV